MHFLFFLLNVFSWLMLGFFVGRKAVKMFGNVRNRRKLLMVGVCGAFFGGMFGFLLNGLNSPFSFNNFFYALVFSIAGVSINNPKFVKTFKFKILPQLPRLPLLSSIKRPAK